MALFSFGKKDKNPPEVAAPVAKTPPTPPKIQTPPGTVSYPSVKPPQPTGLMAASPVPPGTATTQPMTMPRTGATALRPSRPAAGQLTRSTQRIILPTPSAVRVNNTKPLSMGMPGGRINLPMGMILRCLPPEVLAEPLATFEANGTAATEIGLPMSMILGQLPSGKVEMALQDLTPHFPPGYLKPAESIANYLPTLVNLPLMDVVMRIPPDLLALRPDQKDVDASVINMADPFTEEILREQAEAARRQAQTNIIEESQAPQEEFVPQAEPAKPTVPARRPAAEPMIPTRLTGATTLVATPMPAVIRAPLSPVMSAQRGSPGAPPSIPTPARSATPLPVRPQAPVAFQADPPPQSSAPVPPVPRHTGPIPAPPPPRHTTSLTLAARADAVPTLDPPSAPQSSVSAAAPAKNPAAVPPGVPNAGADDLQRLAALAMEQLGEGSEPATELSPKQEPIASSPPEGSVEKPASASATEPVFAGSAPPIPRAEAPAFPRAVSKPPPEVLPELSPEPAFAAPVATASTSEPATPTPAGPAASVAFNLNTCTAADLVQNIPGCFPELAESIVQYRDKIGSFKRLEDLLDVPGITKATYTNLTGEPPPANRIPLSLNELLGFPAEQHLSLKDVTDRIACWPDVTGCVLSQSTGLSLVGTVPEGVNKAAIVAFAPRMFEAINKSFSEVSGQETDALVIPSAGTSFHLFRNRDLYLIIMSRLTQMPERHVKVARFVLAALSIRRD